MTIKRKNIRPSGLLEIEADNTDTVDTNGFSDSIQTVGAKTAKFSGGATMQSNPGLRIGMTQLKINTGSKIPIIMVRPKNVESNTTWNTNPVGQPFISATGTVVGSIVVVDFESIDTQELTTTTSASFGGEGNSVSILYEYSSDNISYTILGTEIADAFNTPLITNWGTFTWRYIRITHTTTTGAGGNTASTSMVEIIPQPPVNDVTIRVHSSITLDTADGTELIPSQLMTENSQLVFDTDLLLTGNAQFVTVEIVSQTGNIIPVTLSEITSIKEV